MRLLRVVALALALAGFQCGPGTIDLWRMPEPDLAARAWAKAQACARVAPVPGGNLADVHWFVADLSLVERRGLWGAWLPPDTIVLDMRHLTDSITIEHELLHHLLRGSVHGIHAVTEAGNALAATQLTPEQSVALQTALAQHEEAMARVSLEELKTVMSESLAEIESPDKYTSRARPTGLYIAYLGTSAI